MKVRILITDSSWQLRLRVGRARPGAYFVKLISLGDAVIDPPAILGGFDDLEWIFQNAPKIYADLVAMHNAAISRRSLKSLPSEKHHENTDPENPPPSAPGPA